MERPFSYHPARGEIIAFGRRFALPRARSARLATGTALVVGGCLGFLPVLGFWMIPLGLLVLSQDVPRIRRMRRNFVLRMKGRRKRGRAPTR
ncbi:hypothetical protein E2A64_08900 [Pseudohoeflea suaedae]|uniref:Uncharacterized protein n=1 Tax=Pseudohoeflea suaedae TaxID=877384 RepID=A0A4R5PPX5_9HYPH|nr:hypothetical protein [Pseudohoeflea suaedae]TDH39174.1 hypothetical protein E2A64_08900 [Pseudohoeflea suaedae]